MTERDEALAGRELAKAVEVFAEYNLSDAMRAPRLEAALAAFYEKVGTPSVPPKDE